MVAQQKDGRVSLRFHSGMIFAPNGVSYSRARWLANVRFPPGTHNRKREIINAMRINVSEVI